MTTVDQHSLLTRATRFLARVTVGASGRALTAAAATRLVRVVVDTQVSLPDMFELTFSAADGDPLAAAGLALGTPVQVFGPREDGTAEHRLIHGEVTAIEGDFLETGAYVTVRGYTLDHRLHRVRRTRSFVGQKDSDIACRAVPAGRGTPMPLRFGANLRRFLPRVTAGNLTPEVEVRAWDPAGRRARRPAARSAGRGSRSAASPDGRDR
jgi:hypothetical protein